MSHSCPEPGAWSEEGSGYVKGVQGGVGIERGVGCNAGSQVVLPGLWDGVCGGPW